MDDDKGRKLPRSRGGVRYAVENTARRYVQQHHVDYVIYAVQGGYEGRAVTAGPPNGSHERLGAVTVEAEVVDIPVPPAGSVGDLAQKASAPPPPPPKGKQQGGRR